MMSNTAMRITQGLFLVSARPDRRANHRADRNMRSTTAGRSSIEFTDDPHPRNTYWEMWGTADVRPPATPAGC